MINLKLIIISFGILILSCNTTKFTPENLPEKQIVFGDGGGFAGLKNEYILLENGQLFFKSNLDTAYIEFNKIKKNDAHQIFSVIETLELTKTELNEPGNVYNYLIIKNEEIENLIQWDPTANVPKEVKTFYKLLKKISQDKKKVSNK